MRSTRVRAQRQAVKIKHASSRVHATSFACADRDVPANTKVDVLAATFGADVWCERPAQARQAVDRMVAEAHQLPLMAADPARLGWTGLDRCHDFYTAMTRHLQAEPLVGCVRGAIDALQQCGEDGGWRARLRGSAPSAFALHAHSVVVATGARPSTVPPELRPSSWACASERASASSAGGARRRQDRRLRVLPVEAALQRDKLRALVSADNVVGVVGGGHTGLIVTMALRALPVRSVRLFVRRPIRLAQWSKALQSYDRWAFRGLKGAAASFARAHRLANAKPSGGGSRPVQHPYGRAVELHDAVKLTQCAATSGDLDAVVFCLGFGGGPPLPQMLSASGEPLPPITAHTQPGGALLVDSSVPKPLRGLYGVGLGFADAEFTSGAAYAEAGFLPFHVRAAEVAELIQLERARGRHASRL